MRRALENNSSTTVKLSNELECVQSYVWIEQQRLGNRACVDLDVDPTCNDMLVPLFSVQTLVENAINHGVAQLTDVGRIKITVRRYSREALIAVADNGPGISRNLRPQVLDTDSSRIHGLQILSQQITLLYGVRSRLRLYSEKDVGTLAVFAVPVVGSETGTGACRSC
jgi:two-component system, sensor histidine kinase ChiS